MLNKFLLLPQLLEKAIQNDNKKIRLKRSIDRTL